MATITPDFSKFDQNVELLKDEAGGLIYEEGITTISYYKGDFNNASTFIKTKLKEIAASNPWICGCLDSVKKKTNLNYPTSPSENDINAIFSSIPLSADKFQLNDKTPYVDICNALIQDKKKAKPTVIAGYKLVGNKKDSLTRVSVIECTTSGEFALVFSMCHGIVDGRTYYDLLNMFSSANSVKPLTVKRVYPFSDSVRKNCGEKELAWMESSSCATMYTLAMMPAMMGCGGGVTCTGFHLDDSRVAEAKTAAAASKVVDYVTTNDIITSNFFMECKSRIGMMGMDCRGRFCDEVGQDHAGNYVIALTMDKTTFGTPSAVRKMLKNGPEYKTTNDPLPSLCKWMVGMDSASFSMATNWYSFAGGLVDIPDCELKLHLPVKNPAYCVFDLLIPFASKPGKMGLLIFSTSSTVTGLKEALPVGDVIDSAMFPAKK